MPLIFHDLITVTEFASLHGVTRRTVYNWIEAGIAPRHERAPGGVYYFERAAANAWKPPVRGRKVRP